MAVGFFGVGHVPLLSTQSKILQLQCVLMSGSATRGQGGVFVPAAFMEGGFGKGWHVLLLYATILLPAQGRSTWAGWQPDVAARAIPTTFC